MVSFAELLSNPLVISMLAGVLCVLLRVPIPQLVSYTVSMMNKATFPLSMVVVGGGLQLAFLGRSENIVAA